MKAFHAYDIRGVYNRDFDKTDVYKVGFFLTRLLKTDCVLVGQDVRVSSPEIYQFLTQGITDAGANVHSIGLSTTPMVYFATAKLGYKASVMITASHNDKEYNGLKISREQALPVGFDTGLNELEQLCINEPIIVHKNPGKCTVIDVKEQYLDFLRTYKITNNQLIVSADCSNGMAGLLIEDLLGNRNTHFINQELDGSFPNHSPNPLIESNAQTLKENIITQQSDLGVIFDGDADRAVFLDEKGQFIPPDLIIALMGNYFLSKVPNAKVLQDIRSSKAVGEYIEALGGEIHTWRVGRAYAALKLREIDGLFGGELAGHYYFKDFYYSDSALLAVLIVMDIVAREKEKGKTLSQLIATIRTYENSGEINFKIKQKTAAMNALKQHFEAKEKPVKLMDFDGYRLEYPNWWFNVRPSNTEPYLRLLVEANSKELLASRLEEIKHLLSSYE